MNELVRPSLVLQPLPPQRILRREIMCTPLLAKLKAGETRKKDLVTDAFTIDLSMI